jgi:hypothetical protein
MPQSDDVPRCRHLGLAEGCPEQGVVRRRLRSGASELHSSTSGFAVRLVTFAV